MFLFADVTIVYVEAPKVFTKTIATAATNETPNNE